MVVVDITVVVEVMVMVPSLAVTTTEFEDPLLVAEEMVLLLIFLFFVELSLSKSTPPGADAVEGEEEEGVGSEEDVTEDMVAADGGPGDPKGHCVVKESGV